jgi:hypothetical protein
MLEIFFPDKGWQMSQDDYTEAKTALKSLIAMEPEGGNAEVILGRVGQRKKKRVGTNLFLF